MLDRQGYTHAPACKRPATHIHAPTDKYVNTYWFFTATMIRDRPSVLCSAYISCLVEFICRLLLYKQRLGSAIVHAGILLRRSGYDPWTFHLRLRVESVLLGRILFLGHFLFPVAVTKLYVSQNIFIHLRFCGSHTTTDEC